MWLRHRCGAGLRVGVSPSACCGVELAHELSVGGPGRGEVGGGLSGPGGFSSSFRPGGVTAQAGRALSWRWSCEGLASWREGGGGRHAEADRGVLADDRDRLIDLGTLSVGELGDVTVDP